MKRRRTARGDDRGGDDQRPKFAHLKPTDSHTLVEVDMRLLEQFNTRIGRIIARDPPTMQGDILFWRCNMSTAMLHTFHRSLLHGVLSLSKGVSVEEALTTLDYENVNFRRVGGGDASALLPYIRLPTGVGARPNAHDIVGALCELVAQAIATMPCIPALQSAALCNTPPTSSALFTVSPTRFWLKFAREVRSASTPAPLRRPVCWLFLTLVAIGMELEELVANNAIDSIASRSEVTFNILTDHVRLHPLGPFFGSQLVPKKTLEKEDPLRKKIASGEKFASEIRRLVLEHENLAAHLVPSAALIFARSLVLFASEQARATPVLANIFGADCLDINGRSFERTSFAKALKTRGIAVIRWSSDAPQPHPSIRPVVFPPNLAEDITNGAAINGLTSSDVALLLERV